MTTRERFLATLRDGRRGCAPRLEREIRDEVLAVWRGDGFPADYDAARYFGLERLQTGGLDGPPAIELRARPDLGFTVRTPADIPRWERSFDRADRFSPHWSEQVAALRQRDWPCGLSVFRGLFLSFGVGDGASLGEHLYFLADYPDHAAGMMRFLTDWTVDLISRALRDVDADYLMFHEPIASFHGPVIGPRTFAQFVGPLYGELIDLGRAAGIELFCWETYGQVEPLLPAVLETGVNLLWLGHASGAGTDYRKLRERLGPEVALMGGIDDGALRRGPEAARREVREKAVPLLDSGRYLPLLDDRVREDVPWRAFAAYDSELRRVLRDSALGAA